jgi:hypothetical protein
VELVIVTALMYLQELSKWFHFRLWKYEFYIHGTVHRDKFPYDKTNWMHQFLKFILEMKLYMFRTVPLSIMSYSLYTQQWYMSYRFVDSSSRIRMELQFHPDPAAARKLSTNLYDIYHCWVYSE